MSRVYRTLEELRKELAARLGFGGDIGASSALAETLNSYLRQAQQQIWQETDWHFLVQESVVPIGVQQHRVNYPVDCDPDRVLAVAINDNVDGSGYYRRLCRGITYERRNGVDIGKPSHFEAYDAQLALYPITDRSYSLSVRYVRRCADFLEDGDRATLDDDLILLWALARSKAHYGMSDAQLYLRDYEQRLLKLKSRGRRRKTFSRTEAVEHDPYLRPVNYDAQSNI